MVDIRTNCDSSEPFFRTVKKRKFLRRRTDNEAEDPQLEAPAVNRSQCHQDSFPVDSVTRPTGISHIQRKQRARKGGIEFSASSRQIRNERQSTAEPPSEDLESEKLWAMHGRFTGHTDQMVDVDKHMMNYIESEMAKRYRRAPAEAPGSTSHTNEAGGGQMTPGLPRREPASLGKLHEIDLGRETKLHNIARTEAATRRLAVDSELVHSDREGAANPPVKGGRVWRGRRRRNSEDIERDRLVDEVLRENKLDVYDEPSEEDHSDDQAADDKIAEQFRREFLDAIQSRRRIARAKNTKPTAKSEAPKGPKLGGSRSARAAMREMQEKSGQR